MRLQQTSKEAYQMSSLLSLLHPGPATYMTVSSGIFLMSFMQIHISDVTMQP